jgi:hypothetical protein
MQQCDVVGRTDGGASCSGESEPSETTDGVDETEAGGDDDVAGVRVGALLDKYFCIVC